MSDADRASGDADRASGDADRASGDADRAPNEEGEKNPLSPAVRPRKAIGMISGGLDSSLALRHVKRLGYEVKALNFYTGFCITETHRRLGGRPRDGVMPRNEALREAADTETEVEFIDVSEAYVEVVTNPRFGYGKNMNPCIDCRIFMLNKAREIMEAEGAEFVFTGEVLGQRPKSQRRDAMAIVERESGLKGRLLRPLSGKFMAPTLAEEAGQFRREDLLGITGRSRKPQIKLAEAYDLQDFPQPAGGCCFLTDAAYTGRFRDLLKHKGDRRYTQDDIILLSAGRHLRLGDGSKLIVSRNDQENLLLAHYREGRWEGNVVEHLGPMGLYEDANGTGPSEQAAAIVARYGQGRDEAQVTVRWVLGDQERFLTVTPASLDEIDPLRV